MSNRTAAHGFSLVELVVTCAIIALLIAVALQQVSPSEHLFESQTEAADTQQRARAGIAAVERDLQEAGRSGSVRGDGTALTTWAPAVLPYRIGLRGSDPAGTFRSDLITVLAARPLPAVQTTTLQPTAAADGATRLASGPGCPPLDPLCGVTADTDLLIADGHGAFDLFTVTGVTTPVVWVRHNTPDWSNVYPIGSTVVPVSVRTYFLRPASGTRPPQLVKYEGGAGTDSPVADHVVGLRFDYFGDPEPPRMRRPLSDAVGPWTTYGPLPPVADATVTPFVAGSNCVFVGTGSALAAPVLASFGSPDSALVPLTAAQLTDGPWCPDATAPDRYDADLLRVRSITMTIRVESSIDAFRGPAGLLFTRGGTARSGDRYVPDFEVRMRITPPNLGVGR